VYDDDVSIHIRLRPPSEYTSGGKEPEGIFDEQEKRFFRYAVLLACLFHLGAACALVRSGSMRSPPQYAPLAGMDFSYYDQEGGRPGEGGPGLVPQEAAPVPPEPEPEQKFEPEPRELARVVESRAETAEPAASPPNTAKPKESKPRLKPAPPPATVPQAGSGKAEESGGGGQRTGNGQGEGQGGSGSGAGRGNPDARQAYLAHIIRKLNRHKKYPAAAQANRLGGVVTVSFTVDRQGQVTATRLAKSSGHAALDQESIALLRRVSPFDAMPAAMTQKLLHLTVPIKFSVQ
jgi:TonB family protein